MSSLEWVATVAILAVLYHHVGYPALLRIVPRRRAAAPVGPGDAALPRVTLVVAAYQEAAHIADKIRNCAALDYPRDRLTIVVASDGSTDDTVRNALAAQGEWWMDELDVRVVSFPVNRGKVAVLNEVIAETKGDIIVATDASALFSVDALKRFAAWFADPGIGVVCATYRLMDDPSAGESAYWRMQTGVLRREANVAAPLGAHGAGYAFRRSAWRPLPADTINDDFALPTAIIAEGYRGVYDESIVALEMEPTDEGRSFRRRRRTGAGNMQQLARGWRLLDPRRPALAWLYLSGKGLRPLVPFLMITAWLASLGAALAGSPPFALLWAGQSVGYALGGLAPVLLSRLPNRARRLGRPLQTLQTLVWGHAAGLVGALRYLGGLERGRWQRV